MGNILESREGKKYKVWIENQLRTRRSEKIGIRIQCNMNEPNTNQNLVVANTANSDTSDSESSVVDSSDSSAIETETVPRTADSSLQPSNHVNPIVIKDSSNITVGDNIHYYGPVLIIPNQVNRGHSSNSQQNSERLAENLHRFGELQELFLHHRK